MTRKIDAKKYCIHLTNPPKVGTNYADTSELYLCKFSGKDCIAKDEKFVRDGYPLPWDWYKAVIDKKALSSCPLYNISDKLAKAIEEEKIKKQISKLEKNCQRSNSSFGR